MLCVVYKSLKQFDYYLYIRKEDSFSRVPDSLQTLLGTLEHVLEFELDEGRKLAQADSVQVMRQIEEQGFYLQMPPRSGDEPAA